MGVAAPHAQAAALLPVLGPQDHKAVGEGDTGPNTGGMGTYTPAPVMTDAIAKQVRWGGVCVCVGGGGAGE